MCFWAQFDLNSRESQYVLDIQISLVIQRSLIAKTAFCMIISM